MDVVDQRVHFFKEIFFPFCTNYLILNCGAEGVSKAASRELHFLYITSTLLSCRIKFHQKIQNIHYTQVCHFEFSHTGMTFFLVLLKNLPFFKNHFANSTHIAVHNTCYLTFFSLANTLYLMVFQTIQKAMVNEFFFYH